MGLSSRLKNTFARAKSAIRNEFEKLEQEGFYEMASPEVRRIVDRAKADQNRVKMDKSGGVSVYRNEDTPARWVLNYDREGNITNEIPRSFTIT